MPKTKKKKIGKKRKKKKRKTKRKKRTCIYSCMPRYTDNETADLIRDQRMQYLYFIVKWILIYMPAKDRNKRRRRKWRAIRDSLCCYVSCTPIQKKNNKKSLPKENRTSKRNIIITLYHDPQMKEANPTDDNHATKKKNGQQTTTTV